MKLATCYLALFLLFSCTPNGVYVVVSNEQDIPVTQVRVSNYLKSADDLFIENISAHQVAYGWLNMATAPNHDGGYQVWVIQNGNEKFYPANGYYTNGSPMADTLYIVLQKDSVLISESPAVTPLSKMLQ